jgi:3-hydroxybutyryl-CoA dehydrogenase
MGPFELMDLIGVDTNLAVTTSVYEGLGYPSRFKPSTIQQQLVREGSFGRKSGKGFYHYAEEK